MNAMRVGAFDAVPAVAASDRDVGIIASNAGSAIAVPSPLRNVRRGMCQLLLIVSSAQLYQVACNVVYRDTGVSPVRSAIEQEKAEAAENASNKISAFSAISCSKTLSCCGTQHGRDARVT